jgi:hypothetical protein
VGSSCWPPRTPSSVRRPPSLLFLQGLLAGRYQG